MSISGFAENICVKSLAMREQSPAWKAESSSRSAAGFLPDNYNFWGSKYSVCIWLFLYL